MFPWCVEFYFICALFGWCGPAIPISESVEDSTWVISDPVKYCSNVPPLRPAVGLGYCAVEGVNDRSQHVLLVDVHFRVCFPQRLLSFCQFRGQVVIWMIWMWICFSSPPRWARILPPSSWCGLSEGINARILTHASISVLVGLLRRIRTDHVDERFSEGSDVRSVRPRVHFWEIHQAGGDLHEIDGRWNHFG